MQKLSTIPRFEEWMDLIKERETAVCVTCGTPVSDPLSKEFLRNVGECSSCDKLRTNPLI